MCGRTSQHGDWAQERDNGGRIGIRRVPALAGGLRACRMVHRALCVGAVHARAADRVGCMGKPGDERQRHRSQQRKLTTEPPANNPRGALPKPAHIRWLTVSDALSGANAEVDRPALAEPITLIYDLIFEYRKLRCDIPANFSKRASNA